MAIRIAQFFAIIITALALIPPGAHLASLPNKITMSQNDYFIAQAAYHRWALLGWLWPAAIIMNTILAVLVRSQETPFRLAALAALCFVLMLVIFLIWTQPANQATQNWMTVPENWEALRFQWEYSHAANAVIAFLALCLATLSALTWRPAGP